MNVDVEEETDMRGVIHEWNFAAFVLKSVEHSSIAKSPTHFFGPRPYLLFVLSLRKR